MKENFEEIKKYNFWDRSVKTGFVRKYYLNKLLDFQNTNLVKVLVGQRRVGKSFVLRQYIHHLIQRGVSPKNTLYINKEYADFDFIQTHTDLNAIISYYKNALDIKGKFYLFIDEIQQIDSWEKIINSLSQDYTIEIEIFITGSNSELLSGELASLLSGRYVQFNIFPFSFNEYIAYGKKEKNRKNFLHYLNEGALPELFHLPNEETKIHYLSSLKDTIILRDIVQRYQIKDTSLLIDIFAYLVNNVSNLFSINNIINYFESKKRKTNYETISIYVQYLTQTFVIHRCERFDIKGKEILAGNVKYYVNDLSFKNYLYSSSQHGFGYLLENIVYLELLKYGFNVKVGALRNKKIDFVATKNDKTIFIQSAFSIEDKQTFEREIGNLLSLKNNYPKWIITLDE